jgi:hypothetical protein
VHFLREYSINIYRAKASLASHIKTYLLVVFFTVAFFAVVFFGADFVVLPISERSEAIDAA